VVTGGVVPSEPGWEAKAMLVRESDGLKRPGDDTGVLLAVLWGVLEEWRAGMRLWRCGWRVG
jgi:hypothetical protein